MNLSRQISKYGLLFTGRYSCKTSENLLQVTAGWLFLIFMRLCSLPYLFSLFFTCTFHRRFHMPSWEFEKTYKTMWMYLDSRKHISLRHEFRANPSNHTYQNDLSTMGLLRFDAEEAHQKQLASRNASLTTTRFSRFQENINLYQRTITMRRFHESPRYYFTIMGILKDTIGQVNSPMLVAEDRELYEEIYSMNELHLPGPSLPTMAHLCSLALVARLSAQSVVYEVLVMLLDEELISRSALHDFADLTHTSGFWRMLNVLEECFDFGTYLSHCPEEVFTCNNYSLPMRWLACMIVRGANVDLETILSTIEIKKSLGAFDWDRYWYIWPQSETLSVNPEASVTDMEPDNYVGMHLPMGIVEADVSTAVHDAFDNFDKLVQTFQDLCGNYIGFVENNLVPVGRSLEQLELLERFNADEEGLVWEDGHVDRVE